MHDCHLCGRACYCGGDIDDSPVGDFCRFGCGCEDDDPLDDDDLADAGLTHDIVEEE